MNNVTKVFVFVGLVFLLVGVVMFVLQKLNIPLGRLPGDIVFKKKKFSFYFPITTCVIISIILSIIFYLFRK